MRAGRLKKLITFERRTQPHGDFGGQPEKWEAVATRVPSAILPVRGEEKEQNSRIESRVTHKIVTRWAESLGKVTPADRIKFGDRVFEITTAINLGERNRWLDFMCVEEV